MVQESVNCHVSLPPETPDVPLEWAVIGMTGHGAHQRTRTANLSYDTWTTKMLAQLGQ